MIGLHGSILVFVTLVAFSTAAEWGYREPTNLMPENWAQSYPDCGGKKQSPVDIVSKSTMYDSSLTPIMIKADADESKREWKMSNNGHSVKLSTNLNSSYTFKGEEFSFAQMHFHWRGSEHRFDNRLYAGELHMVHVNPSATGYSVLGFFMELSDVDNPVLTPLISKLSTIKYNGNETKVTNINLASLTPFQIDRYYHYEGSLTTPGCAEVVKWVVVDQKLKISENQMLFFQEVFDEKNKNLVTNSRPVQPLNDRIVKRSFSDSCHRVRRSINARRLGL